MRFSNVGTSFLAAVLLVSCGSPQQPPTSPEKVSIMTSFLPITLFASAVAGECGVVKPLIPTNIGPHDFQSTPQDLVAVGNKILLRFGAILSKSSIIASRVS